MSGQCITVSGVFKLRRSESLLFLILSSSRTVFNRALILKEELGLRSPMELLHYNKQSDYQLKKHLIYPTRYFDHCKKGSRFRV